jgi:hypothetical protein
MLMLFGWNVNPGSAAVIQITTFHFQSIYILLLGNILFFYLDNPLLPPLFIYFIGGIQWHWVTLKF